MVAKHSNLNGRIFMFYLMLIALSFMCLLLTFKPLFLLNPMINSPLSIQIHQSLPTRVNPDPKWFRLVRNYLPDKKIRIGLLNVDEEDQERYEASGSLILENIHVSLDPLPGNLTWTSLFPTWIDEDHTWNEPKCPEVPLPRLEGPAHDVDVLVVKLPCNGSSEKSGLRDVFRLQVNLAAAKLTIESNQTVHIIFIGSCGPMTEIFRCEERVRRVGDYWIYKPNKTKLNQKLQMPLGSCKISHQKNQTLENQRVAYVTVLHSSEMYVCGAIALAQSIKQSGSIKDMVLLHDETLTGKSLTGLALAGWKLRLIKRIRSPFSKKGSYNEWNYSKLRVWEVVDYDKLIFIDADFIIVKNVDYLFSYPQLSAAGNNRVLFNSGVMVLEPSTCLFEEMMSKSFKIESYNGGDQGFLNEIFVWWHRLSKRVNTMKYFEENVTKDRKRELPDDLEGLHYLGIKPWLCYRDYDCNWDLKTRRVYASESVQERWWKVYDKMPKKLKTYCGLTLIMSKNIEKWRKDAKEKGYGENHWKIDVRDPRKKNLVKE